MKPKKETPAQVVEHVDIIADLLRVIEMLMPGVKYIAVEDYALLNDAPLRARRWLDQR